MADNLHGQEELLSQPLEHKQLKVSVTNMVTGTRQQCIGYQHTCRCFPFQPKNAHLGEESSAALFTSYML